MQNLGARYQGDVWSSGVVLATAARRWHSWRRGPRHSGRGAPPLRAARARSRSLRVNKPPRPRANSRRVNFTCSAKNSVQVNSSVRYLWSDRNKRISYLLVFVRPPRHRRGPSVQIRLICLSFLLMDWKEVRRHRTRCLMCWGIRFTYVENKQKFEKQRIPEKLSRGIACLGARGDRWNRLVAVETILKSRKGEHKLRKPTWLNDIFRLTITFPLHTFVRQFIFIFMVFSSFFECF